MKSINKREYIVLNHVKDRRMMACEEYNRKTTPHVIVPHIKQDTVTTSRLVI